MTADLIKVIVVDDDDMQLELIERALSRDGFDVRGASSATAMTTAAKEFSPSMILMDINMPGTTPEETIAAARAAAASARVILYSAWEDSRLRGLSTRLGADGFVSKSESVMVLGKRLRELNA